MRFQQTVPFMLLGLMLWPPGPASLAEDASRPVPLQATISESRFLPPAMYGQWAVTATLVDTNVQGFFAPITRDFWLLEETGNDVTISNPVTGAIATIGVDKVTGNTATFHRNFAPDASHLVIEQPTVTVDGDRLRGETFIRYAVSKGGRSDRTYLGHYTLQAVRISGARTRFGAPLPQEDQDFEVEDLQPDPTLSRRPKSSLDPYFNPRN